MSEHDRRILLSSPHMSGEEAKLVSEVFESNWIAPTGPMVTTFEEQLAGLTGFGHVAAVSSGTAALHLALRLCGVAPGDEVWGSTMTFIGGVAPILYEGATPVFIDIEPEGLLVDLDLLEQELEAARAGKGTLPKAVITTDLYGHVVDPCRMGELRDRFGFSWISDSAESVGSYRRGLHAGIPADFAVYSFNGNKIITTSGGGALASNDPEQIERARFLSTQARESAPHYEHHTYGYNYRLSNVCAAIGVGQLKVLEERVAARRAVHEAYWNGLSQISGIFFTPELSEQRSNRWLTTISIQEDQTGFGREEARLALETRNIESRPVWKPMHLQQVFTGAKVIGGSVAEDEFKKGLCLPSGSQMSAKDVDRVVEVLLGLVQ